MRVWLDWVCMPVRREGQRKEGWFGVAGVDWRRKNGAFQAREGGGLAVGCSSIIETHRSECQRNSPRSWHPAPVNHIVFACRDCVGPAPPRLCPHHKQAEWLQNQVPSLGPLFKSHHARRQQAHRGDDLSKTRRAINVWRDPLSGEILVDDHLIRFRLKISALHQLIRKIFKRLRQRANSICRTDAPSLVIITISIMLNPAREISLPRVCVNSFYQRSRGALGQITVAIG